MLVGFGSYQGSVVAGDYWGAEMEKMPVPPAVPGSWEALLHETMSHETGVTACSSAPTWATRPF